MTAYFLGEFWSINYIVKSEDYIIHAAFQLIHRLNINLLIWIVTSLDNQF